MSTEIKKPAGVTLPEGHRYVTVPAKDVLGNPFEGIWHNKTFFEPGTHIVEDDIASTLEERLQVFQASTIRLLQPYSDMRARGIADKVIAV